MNKILGAVLCVFGGHAVSKESQTDLKQKIQGSKVNTMCSRCHYPLILTNTGSKKHYTMEEVYSLGQR